MRKLSLLLIVIAFSCAKKSEQNATVKIDSVQIVEPQIVGNDADEHGCKPSTGSQWSVLKNECVQVFNVGIRLNHIQEPDKSYTTSAFVIIDNDKAELFLDTDEKPFIMERKSKTEFFKNGDWELLSSSNKYSLKKKNEVLYVSE